MVSLFQGYLLPKEKPDIEPAQLPTIPSVAIGFPRLRARIMAVRSWSGTQLRHDDDWTLAELQKLGLGVKRCGWCKIFREPLFRVVCERWPADPVERWRAAMVLLIAEAEIHYARERMLDEMDPTRKERSVELWGVVWGSEQGKG